MNIEGAVWVLKPRTLQGLSFKMFKKSASGVKPGHYAAELRTLLVTYPLAGSAVTDTTGNLYEMCPTKIAYRCLPLSCTIDHTQSYKGRLFPQRLAQVVMNRD